MTVINRYIVTYRSGEHIAPLKVFERETEADDYVTNQIAASVREYFDGSGNEEKIHTMTDKEVVALGVREDIVSERGIEAIENTTVGTAYIRVVTFTGHSDPDDYEEYIIYPASIA